MNKKGSAALAKWRSEYNKEYPPPQRGSKVCTKCKKVKKFDVEQRDISEFHIRKNQAYVTRDAGYENAIYLRPDSACKDCNNKNTNDRRKRRWDENPEQMRAKRRKQDKEYRERIGETRWLELKRIRSNRYRRKRGIGLGNDVEPRRESSGIKVPVGPFVDWVNERWPDGGGYTAIGSLVKNSDKMSKIMHGTMDEVDFEWVDEVLTTMGGPHISILYPDMYGK